MSSNTLPRVSHHLILRHTLLLTLYGLASLIILVLFITHEDGISHRTSVTSEFSETVYGTAHKPSVTRVLVPLMIRSTTAVTPGFIKTGVQHYIAKRSDEVEPLGWQEHFYFEYVVACVIMFVFLIGFAYSLRYFLEFYYPNDQAITSFAPVIGLLLLALFFRYRHFIYDPGTLFLFTLGLGLILHKKNSWYYPVFLLSCLNKETTLLMVGVFFLFQRGHMPLRKLLGHVVLQGAIWVAVRAVLGVAFKNNPGSDFELHLFDHNLALIHDPLSLGYFLAVLLLFGLFIGHKWNAKPLLLRQGLVLLLLPLLGLSVLWGYLDAFRVYYEAFPFALALALPSALEAVRTRSAGITPSGLAAEGMLPQNDQPALRIAP